MPDDPFKDDINPPNRFRKFLRDDRQRAKKKLEPLKRRWDGLSHLRQALVIGSAAFLVTLGASEFLWVSWVDYPPDTKAEDELGLQLGFFQTVATFAAAFVAGTLGWLAVQEFREEHKEAELELSIPNAPEAMGEELSIMPGLDSLYSIIVRLQNVGAAKAGFFTVRLSSVFLYDLWKMQNGKNELDRHSGLNFLSQNLGNHEGDLMDDWSAAYRTKITPVENGTRIDLELTLIFRSPPSLALFPWESIALCTIKVPRVVVDPAVKYTMDYTINSDKSKRKEGNITMSFVEEEQYSSGSKPQVFVPEREAYHRTLHDEP